jgi:hypothetical protein
MSINCENTLIALFSYNMGALLNHCVQSIEDNCAGFRLLVLDDDSDDLITKQVLNSLRARSIDVYTNFSPKEGRKHGNLYSNIRHACRVAEENGLQYLLMIQDDMQFVRALSEEVLQEYSAYFSASEFHLQVDPRFLMRRPYEYVSETGTFRHGGLMSYADVGFLDLRKLRRSGWELRDGERENAYGLRARGYLRSFPRTPVMMHVPFPPRYRNGALKRSLLVPFRGRYRFAQMTADEISNMDSRPNDVAPIYRGFLRVQPMGIARVPYLLLGDRKIFS